ncbi:ABC-type nickel/oligopeptides specific transport system, ATPase component [hydrothermal vent metagenome]|uniref:ABC-type nickel/oligopeptides specific transport system, ATPase component n=1 Tax=hydrothermal vent metagenome TaxID=652676 RepID=A0A3B1DSM0_9ZZZZ
MKFNKIRILNKNKLLVDISFEIDKTTALIGESGSGKSLTLKAILQILPSSLQHEFTYESNFALNSNSISLIPQNPFTSLSPLTKINKQFFCNDDIKKNMFQLVGLDENILNKFPNQLSGGQLQRVVIAMALSTKPKLLLLDEPTTSLDTKNKELILNILLSLQKRFSILMLFVTHDIFSIKHICENIIILRKGQIIEQGKTKHIMQNPQQNHTKQLINSSFHNRIFRT